MSWKKTDNRFVAFFDILGFKDMVQTKTHSQILKTLEQLKTYVEKLEGIEWGEEQEKKSKLKIAKNQTRSVTFSDSFMFFSKKDTIEDFSKIIVDSWFFLKKAAKLKIAVKASISFGEITVDFDKNLFFGQPIIDAYLLHEDLNMLGVILDHKAENQMKTYDKNVMLNNSLKFRKVNLKYGSVTHTILGSNSVKILEEFIELFKEMYTITSGKPRIYIDNTVAFYQLLKSDRIKENEK
ncbi:hypothetical protein [Psychroserpens sp. Hel_I_66]|uniref:hypothetical protein n=1 Tax=Psychroserpens sp. Hel_I_66 TaxID=1250004 RepID=UPI000645AA07|nr:hypothetical protein [Psychroserpens sp. Hel_I_66]